MAPLVARVGAHHERVTVTVHGRPTAVLVAVDDLEAMEETIAVLSDGMALPAPARADAERLPESVAFAAHEFNVGPLLDDPRQVAKRLRPPLDGRYSARWSTHRVIDRIDEQRRRVTVVGVFSRADAYRPQRPPNPFS